MPLPRLDDYLRSTHNDKLGQDARGSNIRLVDRALEAWWKAKAPGKEAKVRLLADIVSQCSRWLKKKRKSANKSLTIRRKLRIKELGQAALDELAELGEDATTIAFDRRKLDALGYHDKRRRRLPQRTVPLAGSYKRERDLYLKSGKKTAPSATLLHKYITQGNPEMGDDRYTEIWARFRKKRFEQLTVKDFQTFQDLARKGQHRHEVKYLTKSQRMGYWAVADDRGLLRYQATGKLLDTEEQRVPFTWTMDVYGNLFLGPGEGLEYQFNHSSYNAGKDVLCGGTIKVVKGQLTFLDNSSGHYKPGAEDLLAALRVLADDGTDLDEARIKVVTMDKGRLVEVERVFRNDELREPPLRNQRSK